MLTWLNVSVATLNATLQLLVIYIDIQMSYLYYFNQIAKNIDPLMLDILSSEEVKQIK